MDRIWADLGFYRIVGEPMANVLCLGPGESPAVDELGRLAERWVYLAANNALGSLQDHPDIKKAKEGGSLADGIRAYLEVYRREAGFEKWSDETLNEARFRIIQVWDEFQRKRRFPEAGQLCIQLM